MPLARRRLAVGLAACALAGLLFPLVGPGPMVLMIFAAPIVLAIGYQRWAGRPPWRSLLLLAFLVVLSLRTAWLAVYGGHEPPGLTVGEVYALVSGFFFVVTLAALTPAAWHLDRDVVYDAVIVSFAAALLVWGGIVDPILGREELGSVGTALTAVFPLLLLGQLVLTIRLAAAVGVRHKRNRMLIAGFGLAVAANLVEGALFAQNYTDSDAWRALPVSAWTAAIVVLSAAGVHRLPEHRSTTRSATPRPITVWRTVGFAALTAVPPLVLIIRWIIEPPRIIEPNTGGIAAVSVHLIVPVLLSSMLTVLLVVRTGSLARQLHRQSTALGDALTTQQSLQAELEYRARHDPLTGLGNRTVLNEQLNAALATGPASSRGALLLADLDGFKDVNDTYGHLIGDRLLCVVAERLTEVMPSGATACRLGGDEFAVFVPPVDPAVVRETATALVDVLRRPYRIDRHYLPVTASVGVLLLRGGMTTASALGDADLALYRAKSGGKNQAVVFEDGGRTPVSPHGALVARLRRALAESTLDLVYQPIVDLRSGQVRAVEALARWRPDGGPEVEPAIFIPLAEQTNLIGAIGEWTLRRALADAGRWYPATGVPVAVNFSGLHAEMPSFADDVLATLADSGLPGDALIVEITESVLIARIDQSEGVARTLARLREAGVRVAIDDFGTGYSSLAHLHALPADILKIDQRFLHERAGAPPARSRDFIRAILDIGRVLGLVTVAEGVETPEQQALLLEVGCVVAQGYLLGRPAGADAINTLLLTDKSVTSPTGLGR